MDRIEYILRIIIRLKDEASAKLRAVKTQVDGLSRNSKDATANFDKMNSSITSMTRRLTGLENRLSSVRSTVRQLGDNDAFGAMAEGIDKLIDGVENVTNLRRDSITVTKESAAAAKEEAEEVFNMQERINQLVEAGLDKAQARRLATQQKLAALAEKQATVTDKPEVVKAISTPVKIDLDKVEFKEAVTEEGKKIIRVIEKESGEVIGERRRMKSAQSLAIQFLTKQAKAAEEDATATEEKTKTTKKQTRAADGVVKKIIETGTEATRNVVGMQRMRFSIEQVGKRFQLLDRSTGDIISTHGTYKRAIEKLERMDVDMFEKIQTDLVKTIDSTVAEASTTALSKAEVRAEEAAEQAKRDERNAQRRAKRAEDRKAREADDESTATKERIDATNKATNAVLDFANFNVELSDAHKDYITNIVAAGEEILEVARLDADDARDIVTIKSQLNDLVTSARIKGATGDFAGKPEQFVVKPIAGGGPGGGGADADREFAKQQKQVDRLTERMGRLGEAVTVAMQRLRSGQINATEFFDEIDKIAKLMDRVARSAPVEFAEDAGIKFRRAAENVRFQINALKEAAGTNENVRTFANALDALRINASQLHGQFEVTRGGMQILRREGEQLRSIPIEDLTAKVQKNAIELATMEQELARRQKQGGPTATLERDIQRLNSRIGATKEVLRQVLAEASQTVNTIDESTVAAKRLGEDDKDLMAASREALEDMRVVLEDVRRDYRKGFIDQRVFTEELQKIQRYANNIAGKLRIGSDLRREIEFVGNEAVDQRDRLIQIEKDLVSDQASVRKAAGERQEADRKAAAAKERADERLDQRLRADEALAAQKRVNASLARNQRELDLERARARREATKTQQAEEAARAKEGERARQAALSVAATFATYYDKAIDAQSDFFEHLDERAAKAAKDIELRNASVEEIEARFARAQRQFAVGRGAEAARESQAEFKALSSAFQRISKDFGDTEDAARRFGVQSSRAGELAREALQRIKDESADTGTVFDRLIQKLNSTGRSITSMGDNVASIDNRLRGLAVLAIFVFAQELLSTLTGVVGGLGAVAFSAVAAGGALGGAFVTGISQAIPAVGLLVAALSQVKGVTDALTKADLVEQQGFQERIQQNEKKAQTADTLANASDAMADAEDRVVEANDRVADAQRNLSAAREEARRNLRDLIEAEKDAELAARGAALSQQEAQERLSAALLGGGNLDLQRAELGVAEATRGRTTATSRLAEVRRQVGESRNIGRSEPVQNARDQLREARKAVDEAEEAVRRTNRSFDQARRNAAGVAAETSAAEAQLQFMLSRLSPAQRRLFTALVKIKETYKETFVPITDILVDSFTRGVDSADQILRNPSFLNSAKRLAGQMAGAFDEVRNALLEPERFNKILGIIDNASDNIPQLTDLVIDFGDSWINVALAAEPAFDKIFGWVGDLAQDISDLTSDSVGMQLFFEEVGDHATSWLDLAKAAAILFFTIGSAGGSDTGLTIVQDLTNLIERATKWVKRHRGEVAGFFEDSRKVLYEVGSVVFALGEAIISAFNPESVSALGEFLRDTLIPALETVVKSVGAVVQLFLTAANAPLIKELVQLAIVVTLIATVSTSAVGAIAFLALNFAHFATIIGRILGIFGSFSGILGGIVTKLGLMVARVPALAGLAGVLATVGKSLSARSGGSIADQVFDIAAGPSRTTASGKTYTTQKRGGILGKLGLGKVVQQEADDVIKASDDVAKKGATKFSGSFLSSVGKVLKGGAILSLGVATARGLLTGIKDGDIGHGVQDFMHSLSFGLVKSAGEIAQEAIDKEITPRLLAASDKAIAQLDLDALERPDQIVIPAATTPQITGGGKGGGAANVLFAGRERSPFAEAISKLSDDQKKAIEDIITIQRNLREGIRRRAGDSFFQALADQLKRLREDFPELGDVIDRVLGKIESGAKRVERALGPLRLSINFAFDISRHPNKWKTAIDDMVKEASRLKPAMQEKTRDAVLGMVDQLEKNGDLPAKKAARIKEKVNAQFDKMKEDAAKKSARTATVVAKNLDAARIAIEASLDTMGINVNNILKKFNAKEINLQDIAPKGAAPGVQRILDNLDYTGGARGGWAGMPKSFAGGGMPGLPGERGRDLIPAMIGRGEMVFNHFHQKYLEPAVQAYYGHPLYQTFKKIRGQHAGPSIDWPYAFSGGYAGRSPSGNKTVPIPPQYTAGTPEYIAQSVLGPAIKLMRRFQMIATDAFATAGHEGQGHLYYGTALDAVPRPGASWDGVDAAVAWARSKGLTVLYNGVEGHGRGHHAHFELQPGKMVPGLLEGISAAIKKMVFGGPDGAIKNIGQAMLDKTRKAANKFLSNKMLSAFPATGDPAHWPEGQVPGSGSQRQTIIRAAQAVGIPARYLWGVFGAETNFGRNIATSTAGAQGPFQFMPTTADAYIPGGRANINSFRYAAVGAARYLKELFNMFGNWPAAIGHYNSGPGGTLTNPETAAYIPKVLKYAGSFAVGGQLPGPDGQPVNITAHAGEWIVNKVQQSKLARLAGMDLGQLRKFLGFTGGPTSFAGGGEVDKQEAKINAQFTTAAEQARIADIIRGLYSLPAIPIRGWADLVREANRALRAIDLLGSNYKKRIQAINNRLDRLKRGGISEDEEGRVDTLRDERERLQGLRTDKKKDPKNFDRFIANVNNITKENGLLDQMAASADRMSIRLSNGIIEATYKIERFGKGKFFIKRIGSDVEIAEKALGNVRKELDTIVGQKGVIKETLEEVSKRIRKIRRGGVEEDETDELRALIQQQNNLKDRLLSVEEQRQQAIAAVYEAQVAKQEAQLADIEKRYGRANFTLDLRERLASLFGDQGALANIGNIRVSNMQQQIVELQDRMAAAGRIGNTDMVQQLDEQIRDLQVSITEAINKQFTDSIDVINTTASRKLGRLDLFGRMADALGKVGLSGAANIGGQTISRAGVFNERQSVLTTQRESLSKLLGQARDNPATQKNNELINTLNDQIAELNVQIAENAQAFFQARVEEVNNAANFQLNVLSLQQRIAELSGTIAGTDPSGAIKELLQDRQGVLETQRGGLESLLREAIAGGDQQAINDLTTQLLENQIATLENTQAINELAGVTNVQDWSSTMWQRFREAIFTGTGQVMPRYQQFASTSYAGTSPSWASPQLASALVVAEGTAPTSSNSSYAPNFNINNYGRPVDVLEIARTAEWHRKLVN